MNRRTWFETGLPGRGPGLFAPLIAAGMIILGGDNPAVGGNGNGDTLSLPPLKMIAVPAGTVTANIGEDYGGYSKGPFAEAGTNNVTVNHFSVGETEITWELWKAVYNWATDEARGANKYTFDNPGRQGEDYNSGPVGTNQHPVMTISWRDAVVWCNAYSEAMGKTPAYKYIVVRYCAAVRINLSPLEKGKRIRRI
jgi:hypothetical protein